MVTCSHLGRRGRSALFGACATVSAVVMSGCGPKFVQLADNRQAYTRDEGRNLGKKLVASREIDITPLKKVTDGYLGIPYVWGGDSQTGIDCSAFSRQVFRKAYGLELPRKASWQSSFGVPVFKFGLQPGDLVFFGPSQDSIEHVGIYMGEGKFVNATSSQGVKYSSLDENYWLNKYQFARRIPNLQVVDTTKR
ncbi:MAG TPA: NlpC/P60 family protein [Fibrobacteria bacterium]|nr:NlpC/P60 family protein [Fibrobacteria bacterium]